MVLFDPRLQWPSSTDLLDTAEEALTKEQQQADALAKKLRELGIDPSTLE